jgi:two-component system sensor histidine kinase SenX3
MIALWLALVTAVVAIALTLRGRRALRDSNARLERKVVSTGRRLDDATTTATRLAEALDRLHAGVVVLNAEGLTLWRNDQAAALLSDPVTGALASEAVGRLSREAVQGAERQETLELFGPPRSALEVRVARVDDGAVAIVSDISERRRLEEARSDFVANISHELKTPVGALGLLAETLAGEDDPDVARRLAARMHTEAFRVGRIIEDLLDLSRLEAEETPRREPVPVHVVLAEAVDRLRPSAEHRGIRVCIDEPPARVTVLGDRRQLVSAVHALVENAIVYSDDGGEVRVSATTNGTLVRVVVSDSGIGIPARDLDRIFERFYRVDRARSRDTGGTGLGLAIVRHVASNHRGEVTVRSQEGMGSTFTLQLPAGPGPVAVSADHVEAS